MTKKKMGGNQPPPKNVLPMKSQKIFILYMNQSWSLRKSEFNFLKPEVYALMGDLRG